ncbi:MAG TPA: VOC family protein [Bryobacteraceae bacterium]|nr:VOC family protein [Bryobacteraceae bacterium]
MSRGPFHPIGRRHALGMLGFAGLAARALPAAVRAPRFTAIDHVEFNVSDPEKSIAFYARVFGNTVLKNNRTTRRYLKLGPAFIAMDRGSQIHVDHFCPGIPDFQIADLHGYLEERSIPYKDYPSGRDLYVTDPDGTRMQLGGANSWEQLLKGTASPESIPAAEPIFRPTGIDHILLNVSDPEKSAAFFEQLLGPVAGRNNSRTWFQAGKSRIGLLQTPAGQRAGVNHYCVAAEPFDFETATRKLAEAGAKVESPEVSGAPEFRDFDGYLVQVMPPQPRR